MSKYIIFDPKKWRGQIEDLTEGRKYNLITTKYGLQFKDDKGYLRPYNSEICDCYLGEIHEDEPTIQDGDTIEKDGKKYKVRLEEVEDEYFEFGKTFELTNSSSPIFIGTGIAPDGLKKKCLIAEEGYRLEIIEHNGFQLITFKKK